MEEKIIRATVKAGPKYNVFKSVRRAQSRGHVTPWGTIAPKRPFNNRKRTEGREGQLLRERIYGQVRARHSA